VTISALSMPWIRAIFGSISGSVDLTKAAA
jgi:hypothetical protein